MRIRFLGTRGEIEARTRLHRMHSSLLIDNGGRKIMIDCGMDWLKRIRRMCPSAIFLTHAHSDHAGGLKHGAPCEVFATPETWKRLDNFPIQGRSLITPNQPVRMAGRLFEAVPVEHSLIAPAVGYRITSGSGSIFYVPDVASIPERAKALAGVSVYIGDAATITRPLVRKRGSLLIGHASIAVQLQWCKEESIRRAFFTHCGSQIVTGDAQATTEQIRTLGRQVGINAEIAYDGLEIAV
jgi:phosphoribosyl 1,2-cyclic phosphodiesterase